MSTRIKYRIKICNRLIFSIFVSWNLLLHDLLSSFLWSCGRICSYIWAARILTDILHYSPWYKAELLKQHLNRKRKVDFQFQFELFNLEFKTDKDHQLELSYNVYYNILPNALLRFQVQLCKTEIHQISKFVTYYVKHACQRTLHL